MELLNNFKFVKTSPAYPLQSRRSGRAEGGCGAGEPCQAGENQAEVCTPAAQ